MWHLPARSADSIVPDARKALMLDVKAPDAHSLTEPRGWYLSNDRIDRVSASPG